jgi:peroxiredoxin
MINTRLFILSCLLAAGISQAQKKQAQKAFPVKIDGTVSNYDGRYIYLHHKWDEKDFTDSAKVVNGKFSFSLKSAEPNMYWFTTMSDINGQPNYIFFADPAPLRARLKGDSIAWSHVEGGQAQNDYLEYRNLLGSFVQAQQRMQTDFNEAVQKGDVSTQEAIRNEYQNLNAQYMAGLKNFIKSHPKSPVSGYIVYADLNNPNIPLTEVEEALSYIDKSIANTKFIKLATKRVNEARGSTVGYKANNFSQATPEGKKVSLSDFKGKYVLLDFWASWCRPCRMENPNVVAAYNRYKDKGFTVLGVSLDTNKDPWLAAIQQDKLTWTHVSDLKGWGNEVGKLYGVTGIPQNYLIDREGKIVAKDLRGEALDQKLAEILK